jgi:N-acetylmuramoyl-L-alanine amidase
MMREIKKVVIHCSASNWGTAKDIDKWHKERGWNGIGYHWVITNGRQWAGYKYATKDDGIIQAGRDEKVVGAHVKGQNRDSIGVCLIGEQHFTGKQLYESLPNLLRLVLFTYELTLDDVYGHNQFDPGKTCPNFDVELLKTIWREANVL